MKVMKVRDPAVRSSDIVRRLRRHQLSACLYEVAKIGHYTFDKTPLLRRWMRQAVRVGLVKLSELKRYARMQPNAEVSEAGPLTHDTTQSEARPSLH